MFIEHEMRDIIQEVELSMKLSPIQLCEEAANKALDIVSK
jgi:hypothetical protein